MDERYDAEALRLARQAAAPGETALWAGRPGWRWRPDWAVARPATLIVVIVWVLATRLLEDPSTLTERPWVYLILMTPALAFAIQLAFALRALWRRDRAVYAVTDRRVLILGPDGVVRHSVGLERADQFRRLGRTVTLGGEEEAYRLGKTDLDGGLHRFDLLPRLERLADAGQVMAVIKRADAKARSLDPPSA